MTEFVFWVGALCIVIGAYIWFFWEMHQLNRERDAHNQMIDGIYKGYADAARYVANLPEGDFKEGAFEALIEIGRDIENLK